MQRSANETGLVAILSNYNRFWIKDRNRIKMTSNIHMSEYLSKDILEEEFVRVLTPFSTIQKILGSSRVDARDRFISPPTVYHKIYTIIQIIVATCVCQHLAYLHATVYYTDSEMINAIMFAIYFNIVSYSCQMINTRFFNNDENVKFYIKMQEIDRFMGTEPNKVLYKIQRTIHIVTLVWLSIIFFSVFFLSWYMDAMFAITFLGIAWSFASPILELSYCSNLVVYFVMRVRFINSILINHFEGHTVKPSGFVPTKKHMRYLAFKTHDFKTSPTEIYFEAILECFSTFQRLYRFPILIHFLNFFSFKIISFQTGIVGLQKKILTYVECTVMLVSLLGIVAQEVFLCVRLELFYREIKETKRYANRIMSIYFEGPLRDKAKNMYKRIDEAPPKFSIYDMWCFDAMFIIKSFNLMSALYVTLLQFALL